MGAQRSAHNWERSKMAYIDELLTDGETVEQVIQLHWWMVGYPGILLFVSLIVMVLNSLAGLLLFVCAAIFLTRRLIAYFTTEFVITSQRVFKKQGWIARATGDILRRKVEKVILNQGIIGRALNYGTLQFSGTGAGKITFRYVCDPAHVKRSIEGQ